MGRNPFKEVTMAEKITRYEQVAERIIRLVENGVLKPGDRVPSLRELSRELDVSLNTVKQAYWRLEDRNYIVAVPQSGFYVKQRSLLDSPACKTDADPALLDPQEVSLCRIYGAFQELGRCTPEVSLSIATLDPCMWPKEKLGRYLQDAVKESREDAYNYQMPPGYAPLRDQIARHSLSCGLDLRSDEILITNGCHEAVFLAMMAVCRPGDTVVLESPIYFSLLDLLKQLGLRVIEIPTSDADGINLETLQFVLENHPVRAMFSISNFNNPLGFSMPDWKKKKLVRLLAGHGVPLVEDDIYGDLAFEQRPTTCKTYDSRGDVLLCSSFSKTLAPGLRVGWIVPGRYYDQVIKLKTLLNIATASANQIAVAKFLREGGYERHLRQVRKQLKTHLTALRAGVLKWFPAGTRVTNPDGGVLLWVELPPEADTAIVFKEALAQGIMIAPGRLFSISSNLSNCMRLNAGIWNPRMERAIRTLGDICTRQILRSRRRASVPQATALEG